VTRKELVERFLATAPAKEPFGLCEWMYISDPAKYHEALMGDVKAGSKGPRARTGALFSEIELYLKARGS
jgi:hypothetical protein